MLRIRDVYPGSRILLCSIPDPASELSPSRIPDPHEKILIILTQKKNFLSSKKCDPSCSSRIRMLTFSHPGSRGQKGASNPGSGSATLGSGMETVRILDMGWKKSDPGSATLVFFHLFLVNGTIRIRIRFSRNKLWIYCLKLWIRKNDRFESCPGTTIKIPLDICNKIIFFSGQLCLGLL